MDTGRNKRISADSSTGAGKVTVDSRGRNVWQWNDDQLDNTSILLKRLENPELALEPTRRARKLKAGEVDSRREPDAGSKPGEASVDEPVSLQVEQTISVNVGGGFDPYNKS